MSPTQLQGPVRYIGDSPKGAPVIRRSRVLGLDDGVFGRGAHNAVNICHNLDAHWVPTGTSQVNQARRSGSPPITPERALGVMGTLGPQPVLTVVAS